VSAPQLPEELVTFVEVLGEDEDLRAWFESFADAPHWQRAEEFRKLAARMHAAGEHPDLVRATVLLAEPEVYGAVRKTLAEGDS
jgi:hypothetical protein